MVLSYFIVFSLIFEDLALVEHMLIFQFFYFTNAAYCNTFGANASVWYIVQHDWKMSLLYYGNKESLG